MALLLRPRPNIQDANNSDIVVKRQLGEGITEKQTHIDGLLVNYLEAGTGDRSILLVHGGVNNTAYTTWYKWNRTIEVLSKDYRVIAPDLPGCGESESPKKITNDYYVNFLQKFADRVGLDKVSIVGTSMGGAIAAGYMLENPTKVENAVFIAPYGFGSTFSRLGRLGLSVPQPAVTHSAEFLNEHLDGVKRILRHFKNEETVKMASRAIKNIAEQGAEKSFFQLMRNEAVTARGFALGKKAGVHTNYLERILQMNNYDTKILFVMGESDSWTNIGAIKKTDSELTNSTLRQVEGCKHSPHFQEPDKFNAILKEFLRS